MDPIELKAGFQKFLDCKENTAQVAEKGIKIFSVPVANQVITEQDNCLQLITELYGTESKFLEPYRHAVKATKDRIMSEKNLYQSMLNNKFSSVPAYNLAVGLTRLNENQVWGQVMLERARKESPDSSSNNWGSLFALFFLIFIGLITYYSKNKSKISPEQIRAFLEKNNPGTPLVSNNDNQKKNDILTKNTEPGRTYSEHLLFWQFSGYSV